MSRNKQIIEIAPPDYECIRENFVVSGYPCPVCHGQGGFSEQTGHNTYQTSTCDYCDGTGKVKAKVQIEWRPDYGE